MIAKYQGQYFCIDLSTVPLQIWRYQPIEGFDVKRTRRGTVYYEKTINLSELDEVFDVGFSALWNGEWCGFTYSSKTDRIEVYSNDTEFAQKHNMETIERFAYKLIVPLSSISEFKVVFMDYRTGGTTREETISLDEMKVLWKQFQTDLLPH